MEPPKKSWASGQGVPNWSRRSPNHPRGPKPLDNRVITVCRVRCFHRGPAEDYSWIWGHRVFAAFSSVFSEICPRFSVEPISALRATSYNPVVLANVLALFSRLIFAPISEVGFTFPTLFDVRSSALVEEPHSIAGHKLENFND